MKNHLMKFFTRAAEHHVRKSQHHTRLAGHYGELSECEKASKSEMDGAGATYASLAACHKAMAEEHAAMGEHCVQCCKSLRDSKKAAGMSDELEPSPIRFPIADAPKGKLVLRAGMPQPTEAPIAGELEKVFANLAEDE
jgi:hypothetical protein